MVIDTHCHLTLCAHLTLNEHIHRAREVGVKKILDPGLWISDFVERYKKLSDYPEVLLGLAAAPHYKGLSSQSEILYRENGVENLIKEMEKIIHTYTVAAIGEVGLDYFHQVHSPKIQQILFKRQLELAQSYDLPVFLHIRNAYEDAFRLVKESGCRRGAVHCFTGNIEDAHNFLDWGFYLSFSGIVTFKKSEAMREIVKNAPIDKILTETDSPFLTPTPYRGQPNEAGYIIHINQCVAEVKNLPLEECKQQLWDNAQRLLLF